MQSGTTKSTPRQITNGAAAVLEGNVLILNSSGTVEIPAASTAVPIFVADHAADAAAELTVLPLTPGDEVWVRAGGSISVGGKVEFILSSTGAGTAQAFSSGTVRGIALTAAASGNLVKIHVV